MREKEKEKLVRKWRFYKMKDVGIGGKAFSDFKIGFVFFKL